MKSVNQFAERLFTDEPETSPRGNAVRRAFMPSERYIVDFAEQFAAEGWEQFDTDQDAPYFGFWINKTTLRTLTYCEGDWTFVSCPDAAHFNAEIEDAIKFYGEGFIAKAFDADGMTTYRQERQQFLITA